MCKKEVIPIPNVCVTFHINGNPHSQSLISSQVPNDSTSVNSAIKTAVEYHIQHYKISINENDTISNIVVYELSENGGKNRIAEQLNYRDKNLEVIFL
jgi:hypothetical protein